MHDIQNLLSNNPIIAAIRNASDLDRVLEYNIKIVFILFGNLIDLREVCKRLHGENKIIFVHVDMIEGLKSDSRGFEYLKREFNPFGIITAKPSNIKPSMEQGFYTIQRIFILDSQSVHTGISNIHAKKPDAVEVMPGIAYKIIETIKKEVNLPIIAGGLINYKEDVTRAISAGAIAISTSNQGLWDIKLRV